MPSPLLPILTVNLTRGDIGEFIVPDAWVEEYFGGASLAARMLYESLSPEVAPLSEEASLLFLNGPLTGTSGPAVGRFVVCGRSPATGLWAESNCGGFWGYELRRAGYDGIWITGKSAEPVYLSINDGKIDLREAVQQWGMETDDTQESISDELNNGKVRVACIGPAGEREIPFALILTDHGRVAGRTGLGAVMGSKKLKAIAVKGSGEIPLIDPKVFSEVRSKANTSLRKDTMTEVFKELGSSGGSDYFDYLGEMPKKGFTRGSMDGIEQVSGTTIAETIVKGVTTCHACVIACGRVVQLPDGIRRKGAEYETIIGFGPNLLINDVEGITILGEMCDRYGMDSISMSNTISLAFTLFELGIITTQDTEGLELSWSNVSLVKEMVELTAAKEGFGKYLSMGARNLGSEFGAEELAVQVNGLEVAYHDPRGSSGMALVYATSPRGACHNQSDYFLVDIGQVESELGMDFFPHQGGAEKANNVAIHQDWRTVFNSLVMCYFANLSPQTVVDLINPALGINMNISEMMKVGERGWNLKRLINIKLGLTKKNDMLPKTLLEPLPDGGSAGYVVDFEGMISAYYDVRGWDANSGFPTKGKLRELNLEWVELPSVE